jgi:hypothetical protein
MTDPDPERTAGIAALAACVDALPARNSKVRATPLHPKTRAQLAEQLWDRGVRVLPELAVVFPIPGKQIPGIPAYMSLPQWVNAERYARHMRDNPQDAAAAPAGPSLTIDQLRKIFAIVNPDAAAKLPTLSDAELAAEREAYAARVPAAVQRLAQIADRNHRMQQGAARNERGGAPQ